MLINPINLIKITNNNTLPKRNFISIPLKTDVFERTISFKGLPQPQIAKTVPVHLTGEERLNLISGKYQNNSNNKIIRALNNKIVCLSDEEFNRAVEIADTKGINIEQALPLAAFHNDDENIERAKKLIGKKVNNQKIPEELIAVLAKEYTDEQMQKTADFVDSVKKITIDYRTLLTVKDLDDEQIQRLTELSKSLTSRYAIALSRLSKEEYQSAEKLMDDLGMGTIKAVQIASMGIDAVNNTIKLIENNINPDFSLISADKETIERAIKIKKDFGKYYLQDYYLADIAKNKKGYERLSEIFQDKDSILFNKIANRDIITIEDDKLYHKALRLIKESLVDAEDAEDCARSISDENEEKEFQLLREIYNYIHSLPGITSCQAYMAGIINQGRINEKTLSDAEKIYDNYISRHRGYFLYNFEGEQLDIALKMAKAGISREYITQEKIKGLKNDAQLYETLKQYEDYNNNSYDNREGKVFISEQYFSLYASLNDEQKQTATKLYEEYNISQDLAAIWAKKYNKEQIERIMYLDYFIIDETHIPDIIEMDETSYEHFLYLEQNYEVKDTPLQIKIAKLDDNKLEKLLDLCDEEDISFKTAYELVNLNDKYYKQNLDLWKNYNTDINTLILLDQIGDSAYKRLPLAAKAASYGQEMLEKLLSLNKKEYQKAQKLYKDKYTSDFSILGAKLNDENLAKAKKLIHCFNTSEVFSIIEKYNDEEIEKIMYWKKKGVPYSLLQEFLNLNEEEIKKAQIILDKAHEISPENMWVIKSDDDTFNKICSFFFTDNLYSFNSAKKLNFKDFNEQKYQTCKNIKSDHQYQIMEYFLEMTNEEIKNLIYFNPRLSMSKNYIMPEDIIKFDEKTISQAIKLKVLDYGDYENNLIPYLCRLDNARLDRVLNSLNLYDYNASDFKEIALYINNLEDIKKLPFSKKIQLKQDLITRRYHFEDNPNMVNEMKDIDTILKAIDKSFETSIIPTDVNTENIKQMMKGFFANNEEIENTLKNANIEKYGKNGLPLKYSRNQFLNDLSNILNSLDEKDKNKLTKKLQIQLKYANNVIIGYDGIIAFNELDLNDKIEKQIYDTAHKFIYENKIITGNKDLDNCLNSLITGMPEFINVIGKKQHAVQNYSVDVHILKVLKGVLNDENYKNLTNADKTALKFTAIFHDIAKPDGVKDPNHPALSAVYAKSIMNKYNFSESFKDRIYELVKNHHWLADYNNNKNDETYTASLFRYRNDYEISKILTRADLKGVSDFVYNSYISALSKSEQSDIVEALNNINSTGQLLYTSKIINKDLIPIKQDRRTGKQYKVINFSNLDYNFDLSQYGFIKGTTPENLRLLVHSSKLAENLKVANLLSDIENSGFICTSFISLHNKTFYQDNSFGLSIEAEHKNIANASKSNQSSGRNKDFKDFSKIINGKKTNSYRTLIPTEIKKILSLSKQEYKILYEKLSGKKYLSQIKDDEVYTIGDKKLTGLQIKSAIKKADDLLIKDNNSHNEVNVYNPKVNALIVKVNSLEEIPYELLDFAEENDLTIYILGR